MRTAYQQFQKHMRENYPGMATSQSTVWNDVKRAYIRDNGGPIPKGLTLSDYMPYLPSAIGDVEFEQYMNDEAPVPGPLGMEAPAPPPTGMEAPAPPPPGMEAPAPSPPLYDIYPKRNQMYGDELEYTLPSKDPTERAQILTKLMNDDEFIDDLGQPLPKEAILQIAMLQPIWGRLTATQKKMFLEDKGVLPNGRGYISKTVVPNKPDKPKVKLLNRLGETIVI